MSVLPGYATKFDSISLSACFLSLKGVGESLRQATGFFWRRSDKIFLITNWHVATGKNIMTGQFVEDGWCPKSFSVQYFAKAVAAAPNDAVLGSDGKYKSVPTFELPVYEEFHDPFWIQHQKIYEYNIDLVAFEIHDKKAKDDVVCVNDYNYPQLYHFAGSEIFVLGYPIPQVDSKSPFQFPVWKRGSIASEILVPWNMRPAFLIDSRTSKGMSGSPVFSRVFGPAAYGDGTIRTDKILTTEFMGVYSGRLFDDENNASLGLVWRRNLIDEMLNGPAKGSRDWQPSAVFEAAANFWKANLKKQQP